MHDSRTANLLGAAALAVADVGLAGAARAEHKSMSAAAALLTLFVEPQGVTELGRRIGLSQPATSRVIGGLVADGSAERRTSGRSVEVRLTPAGQGAARRLLAARETSLIELLDPLEDRERELLASLLSKVLGGLYDAIGSTDLICRLCDRAACASEAICPVGEAARQQTHQAP